MLFITGFLTSIHCVSMCGAINLVAVVNHSSKRNLKRPILYNLGRVISYTLLGGIVGIIGNILSFDEKVSGIIIISTAIIMFLMVLNMLGILNFKNFKVFQGKILSRNPFVIGLFNGFMPCGPLQAMQVYALSTGSFIKGALAMLLFGLGTVPLMLLAGFALNFVKGKGKILVNKIASVMILLLSIVMLNRGLIAFHIDVFKNFNHYDNFSLATIKDDYQVIEFDLSYDSFQDIIVLKNIPVKMIVHVDKKYLTGCNNELIIGEFGIKQELKVGDNTIEFIPTKVGEIPYTCWMNMIKNTIKVIDDEKYFKGE
ncbi:MAG: sulfite exporter TauE/SafE family protein [Erysipelotrichaceae bacterium]|nr:sulfite exporter TauE/SafE family protein [Erysipelotrichaceae bacterium]